MLVVSVTLAVTCKDALNDSDWLTFALPPTKVSQLLNPIVSVWPTSWSKDVLVLLSTDVYAFAIAFATLLEMDAPTPIEETCQEMCRVEF